MIAGRLWPMPSRHKSSKSSKSPTPAGGSAAPVATGGQGKDPAAMFAAAVKETEARDKVQREKERQQREAAAQRAADERAHADALKDARRELDRSIEAVRAAKRDGRSTVDADARWKAAKAAVIELETGARPTWAPPPAVEDVAADDEVVIAADDDASSPLDDGSVGEEQA